MSNGLGLGTSEELMRKKASWRDSTLRMGVTELTASGSLFARAAERDTTAPMLALVMTFALARKSLLLPIGRIDVHAGIVDALLDARRFSTVATWTCS